MKLKAYLMAVGESETRFARRCRLPQQTVNYVARGGDARGSTLLRMIRASEAQPAPCGGTLTLGDLVPRRALLRRRRHKAA